MTTSRISGMMLFAGMVLLSGGCKTTNQAASPAAPKVKFNRLFSWGIPKDEKTAARYASAGVTDTMVRNKKEYDLALKYGMTPYWKCFLPAGPHRQVMTPEEEKHYTYINGLDLDRKLRYSERAKIIHQRRIEKQHRYGGEMVTEIDTLPKDIPCFISDEGLELSRKKVDLILKDAPSDAGGIYMDYIGYMNHHGCYCEQCLSKYQKYLAERNLKDSPENKAAFYREKMVEYYNRVIDYVKSKRPNFKIVVHIYPDFKDDHLFGNRTKADYCGQTVSWYFKFDNSKIKKYTDFVLNHAKDYYSSVEGIPFIGVSTNKNGTLGYKTPEEIEQELRIILAAGGNTVMVCNGEAILEPGYYEVFRKYCGKE